MDAAHLLAACGSLPAHCQTMPAVALVCASGVDKRESNFAASRGSDSAITAMTLGKTKSRTAFSDKFPAQASAACGSFRAHCRETFSRSVLRPSTSLAWRAKFAAACGSTSLHCETMFAKVVCRCGPEGSFSAQSTALRTSLLASWRATAIVASSCALPGGSVEMNCEADTGSDWTQLA